MNSQAEMPESATMLLEKRAKPTTQEKLSPYICEFVGTFVLTFVVACCNDGGDKTWNATAIALTLMAMIYSVSNISGGCLNPCVSLALGLVRKMSPLNVILYSVIQLLGSILAGLTISVTFKSSLNVDAVKPYTLVDAFFVEFIYTMMLCFVVLNVAASNKKNPKDDPNQYFALAIGFVIIAGGYAAGGISGAYFNPAIAIGLDLAAFIDSMKFGFCIVYACFQVLGAVGAAGLFFIFRHQESNRSSLPLRMGAEFVGTFALILTVGLNLVQGNAMTAWAAGAALTSMIYALGDISGGHFNPAVSLAIALSGRGKIGKPDALFYVFAQCIAGLICAILILHFHITGPTPHTEYPLAPTVGHDWLQAGLAEVTFTLILVYTVLTVATTTRPTSLSTAQNFYYGLAIGSCVTVAGVAIAPISGASINPAVSLALALEESAGSTTRDALHLNIGLNVDVNVSLLEATGTNFQSFGFIDNLHATHWWNFIWYGAFEFFGGALAVLIFHVTHPSEFKGIKDLPLAPQY